MLSLEFLKSCSAEMDQDSKILSPEFSSLPSSSLLIFRKAMRDQAQVHVRLYDSY